MAFEHESFYCYLITPACLRNYAAHWLLLPPAARKSNYLHCLWSSALLAFMAISSTVVKWDVQGKAFHDSCYPKSENVPK